MSQDDVSTRPFDSETPDVTGDLQDALKLAQERIRKLDEESNKKLERVTADDKAVQRGVA